MSATLLRNTLESTRCLWANANGDIGPGLQRDSLAIAVIRQGADWWRAEPVPPAAPWGSLLVWTGLLAPVVEAARRHTNLGTTWLELQGHLRTLNLQQTWESFA